MYIYVNLHEFSTIIYKNYYNWHKEILWIIITNYNVLLLSILVMLI